MKGYNLMAISVAVGFWFAFGAWLGLTAAIGFLPLLDRAITAVRVWVGF